MYCQNTIQFFCDPKLKGAPTDHKLEVREIRLSSGAEFVSRGVWFNNDYAWFT